MQNYRSTLINEKPATAQPSSLKKTFLEALAQVKQDQSISFSPIDAWVYLLAIPSTFRYTLDETRQIAKEIQHTILPPKKPRSLFQIVTWPEIANRHFREAPSPHDWFEGASPNPFEDGSQFVFFIDTEHLKKALLKHLKQSLFQVTQDDTSSALFVNDGHLELPVPMLELAESALWSALDFNEVTQAWTQSLLPSFQLAQRLLQSLKARFRAANFSVEGRKLIVSSATSNGALPYAKMLEALQWSGMSPAEWVKPFSLQDLLNFEGGHVISVRSEGFLRVRPSSLSLKCEGHLLVAERERSDRLVAILAEDEEADRKRFSRFEMEDRRQLFKRHFNGHSFCQEDINSFALALIGDQVASVLQHPELVRGILASNARTEKAVRVVAVSEDIAIIAHANTAWSTIESVIRRAQALLLTLHPDGSDALFVDRHLDLPDYGCGNFSFLTIPAPYFDLMETASDTTLALPPGRSQYLRGLAFELIREWGLAEHEFRRAFSVDSNDGDIAHALGRALGEMGRHKDALPFLKKATLAVPEDPEIANTYGLALLKCNHPDLATKSLERAVELAPDDPQFLSNLGQSYFMSQRIKDAEHILGKALEYAPSFSDAHSTMAQIKWRQGDIAGARKHARKAFAANPSNKGIQDLLWALTVDEHK